MSEKNNTAVQESIPPMGIRMIAREFKKDKIAIFSLGLLVVLLLVIFIGAMLTDQDKVMYVSIFDKYAAPGAVSTQGQKFILGADEGGYQCTDHNRSGPDGDFLRREYGLYP